MERRGCSEARRFAPVAMNCMQGSRSVVLKKVRGVKVNASESDWHRRQGLVHFLMQRLHVPMVAACEHLDVRGQLP